MTLPYPLPPVWKLHAEVLRRRWPAVFWAVVAVGLALAMIVADVRGDVGVGILLTAVFGAVGAGLGVSYEREGSRHGLPLLLNAVVLTRARVRPPDSWIHFFRETGASRWLAVCFATTGALALLSLIWIGVTVLRLGGAALWWLALVGPLLLGAMILALAGGIAVAQFVRHASFGRRPIGISLGRHGVIRYYMDGVYVWPWENIARVDASGKAISADDGDFSAELIIVPAHDSTDTSNNEYPIHGYQSHPWLIYTAVRFWAEHPELRTELGTTFAQRRIDGWRVEMAARAQAS